MRLTGLFTVLTSLCHPGEASLRLPSPCHGARVLMDSNSQSTRERILEEACEHYAAHGVEGFSMRQVAARLSLSATALYRHFDNKEALIMAVCQRGFQRFEQALMRGLKGADPLERVRQTGLGYLDFARLHPSSYRAMFMRPFPSFEQLKQTNQHDMAPSFLFLVDRVADAQRHALIQPSLPPERLAASIWAHVHGYVCLLLDGHLRFEEEEALIDDYLVHLELMLDGLRSR